MLQNIPTQTATPERLAWMNFWARSYAVSDATLATLTGRLRMMLTVLERMSLEAYLQVRLIMDPLSEERDTKEKKWRETMNRMRAYAAWCLWA